jgi:Peptidase MA superfamily
VSSGGIIPLDGLVGQFPTTADQFQLAYGESVSAVDFMIRTYGKPALVKLIRSYAGGVSDDAAFSAALGVDAAGFNTAWLKDLGAATPRAYGPQPAPAGAGAGLGTGPGASAGPSPTEVTGQSLDSSTVLVAVGAVVLVLGLGLLLAHSRRRRSGVGP